MKKTFQRLTCIIFLLVALSFKTEPIIAQLVYDNPVFEYKDNRDPESPRPSPNAVVGLQIGSSRILIAYGSPAVKGRTIFGGLVPYGGVWRTGANEATTITFSEDVLIEENKVSAGTYSLHTIPRDGEWTIIINKENNQWGSFGYKEDEDILRIRVPSQKVDQIQERMTFSFSDVDTDEFSASVILHWDNVKVSFKVQEP